MEGEHWQRPANGEKRGKGGSNTLEALKFCGKKIYQGHIFLQNTKPDM